MLYLNLTLHLPLLFSHFICYTFERAFRLCNYYARPRSTAAPVAGVTDSSNRLKRRACGRSRICVDTPLIPPLCVPLSPTPRLSHHPNACWRRTGLSSVLCPGYWCWTLAAAGLATIFSCYLGHHLQLDNSVTVLLCATQSIHLTR